MASALVLSDLKSKIDTTAIDICHLMAEQERDTFFEFQEARDLSGAAAPRSYARRRTYYKGARKGQIKDVFEVDGQGFVRLWNLLYNYAWKSSFKSLRRVDPLMIEDLCSEIKLFTLSVLRFWGPTPYNTPFSAYFNVIVKNVLTNEFKDRNRKDPYTTSLSAEIGHNEDGESLSLLDLLSNPSLELPLDYSLSAPESLQDAAYYLSHGASLRDAAAETGTRPSILKQQLASVYKKSETRSDAFSR